MLWFKKFIVWPWIKSLVPVVPCPLLNLYGPWIHISLFSFTTPLNPFVKLFYVSIMIKLGCCILWVLYIYWKYTHINGAQIIIVWVGQSLQNEYVLETTRTWNIICGCCFLIVHASFVWPSLLGYCDVVNTVPSVKVNNHCFVAYSQCCATISHIPLFLVIPTFQAIYCVWHNWELTFGVF